MGGAEVLAPAFLFKHNTELNKTHLCNTSGRRHYGGWRKHPSPCDSSTRNLSRRPDRWRSGGSPYGSPLYREGKPSLSPTCWRLSLQKEIFLTNRDQLETRALCVAQQKLCSLKSTDQLTAYFLERCVQSRCYRLYSIYTAE